MVVAASMRLVCVALEVVLKNLQTMLAAEKILLAFVIEMEHGFFVNFHFANWIDCHIALSIPMLMVSVVLRPKVQRLSTRYSLAYH